MEQSVNWNDGAIATLKTMWAAGFSHGDIMPHIPGATRSSIAGKIMRLKLPVPDRKNSPQQVRRQYAMVPRPASAPSAQPSAPRRRHNLTRLQATANRHDPSARRNPTNSLAEKIAIAEAEPGLSPRLMGEKPDGTGIKFIDLERGQCKWPKGDPISEDFEFCGHKALTDMPYCAHHSRIAYSPAADRRRARPFF